jgi:hypothetical protein
MTSVAKPAKIDWWARKHMFENGEFLNIPIRRWTDFSKGDLAEVIVVMSRIIAELRTENQTYVRIENLEAYEIGVRDRIRKQSLNNVWR